MHVMTTPSTPISIKPTHSQPKQHMSGTGRKSAYRKSVTEEVLNSFPEPDLGAGERLARVVHSRGGNILQVRFWGGGGNGWYMSVGCPVVEAVCRTYGVGRLPLSSYLGKIEAIDCSKPCSHSTQSSTIQPTHPLHRCC